MEVWRFDRSPIGKLERGDDGTLRGDAVVTRAGVFLYRGPGGETIRELRPANEVFHADSLASARMLPITIEHPAEGHVSPNNVQALAVGWTGENVRRDGAMVVSPVRISAEKGISAVQGGKRQLSLGYRCEVERKDGVHEGERYDQVQRRIRYNHLALVDEARAGDVASVRLDAADAIQIEGPSRSAPAAPPSGPGRTQTMQLRLDNGCSYDVPPEVEAAFRGKVGELAEAKTRLDAITAERDAAVKARDTAAGERDSAKSELEKAQKTDHAEAVKAGVKARMAVESAARRVLAKDVVEKLDSMSDEEIRVAVIQARSKDFDPEGRSDEYIRARFDGILESLGTADSNGKAIAGDGSRSDGCDEDKGKTARDKAFEEQKARSRGKKA